MATATMKPTQLLHNSALESVESAHVTSVTCAAYVSQNWLMSAHIQGLAQAENRPFDGFRLDNPKCTPGGLEVYI